MSTLSVSLSLSPAVAPWPETSPVSLNASGACVHLPAAAARQLRAIQQAARKLAGMGYVDVALTGDLWSPALQWAFAQGFARPQPAVSITFTGSDDDVLELTRRWQVASWVRTVTHQSPAVCYPQTLCEQAETLIRDVAGSATVTATRWVGEALAEAGFVGVHQVGLGSINPPQLLKLDINPTGNPDAPVAVALVGKGITFDSGGYSLKPSLGMLTMKHDMGGAATVTAALALALLRGLNTRVQLILCCAENLVSERSYKLGDVLTYKNGVTVEIVNTDAEGRLVLADGLLLAGESNPQLVIDAATLTGAATTAVGTDYNALFALSDTLRAEALTVSAQEHDPLWALPLEPWHRDQLPSDFAVTANSRAVPGGGPGGASNAAGFLSRFAPNDGANWLHFDIAGSYHGNGNGLWAAGATAMGVLTIARLINNAG